MHYEIAALIARTELAAVTRRAELMGSLGTLPSAPAVLPLFRRRAVTPLQATVEVAHARRDDRVEAVRRPGELSVQPVFEQRKAS